MVLQVVQALEWVHVDHHFASGREYLAALYKTTGYAADTLTVSITAADGSLVFQDPNAKKTNGRHAIGHYLAGWDGKGNQGNWNGVYITAALSPHSVTVAATTSGAGVEDELGAIDVIVSESGALHAAIVTRDGRLIHLQPGAAPRTLVETPELLSNQVRLAVAGGVTYLFHAERTAGLRYRWLD